MRVEDLAAAFSFRWEDLFDGTSAKFAHDFAYFAKDLVFIESSDDDRYLLFADMSAVALQVSPPGNVGEFAILAFDYSVPVFALTREEAESGEDPKNGLQVSFRLSSNGSPVRYSIGVFEDALGRLEMSDGNVQNPANTTSDAKEAALKDARTYFVGARMGVGNNVTVTPESEAPELTDWIAHSFPEYQTAISRTVFSDVQLIKDVAVSVMPTMKLVGEVLGFWDTVRFPTVTALVAGSADALLIAPDCPTKYSEATIEPTELSNAESSVSAGGAANLSDIHVVSKSLLNREFLPAVTMPYLRRPFFSLWLSKPLLSKTFDARLGKNLGAMLGVFYSDSWGPIKWYLSSGWIINNVVGSLDIDLTSAALDVRFNGRTKFEALSYIDIGCFSYKLGDMDAFHEQFDFTLSSKVYFSPNGKLVFMAEAKDAVFGGWQCFIDAFLDRYNNTWSGMVTEIVAKYIVAIILRQIVEGKITDALGLLSLDLFDFRRLPVVGELFEHSIAATPSSIDSDVVPGPQGLDIIVGHRG